MIFLDAWENYKKYGSQPSTQDVLKFVAIIIMIIDHLGYFFFPEQLWWRAIGRIGFPVWFFLAGFARPGKTGSILPVLAVMMVVADVMASEAVLPLNALFSVMACRWLTCYVDRRNKHDVLAVIVIIAVLVCVLLPTLILFEYGSQALLFGLTGYYYRFHRGISAHILLFASFVVFIIMQQLAFPFDVVQCSFMAAGTLVVCFYLQKFQVRFLEGVQWYGMDKCINFLSRNSLYVYFLHFLLFEFVHYLMFPPAKWGFFLLGTVIKV